VVIIDITGVRNVDASVGATLKRMTGALRLLGVETIITGMKHSVAQTLIGLGVELLSIESRSNLKAGIAYAISRTGKTRLG
jgi:anti-anti-sigma regulatory factor